MTEPLILGVYGRYLKECGSKSVGNPPISLPGILISSFFIHAEKSLYSTPQPYKILQFVGSIYYITFSTRLATDETTVCIRVWKRANSTTSSAIVLR